MFTVECPGCQASYQVDERRVPASGLRMRCPKCGTAFVVQKPGETPAPDDAANSPGDLPARVAPKPVAAAGAVGPRVPPSAVTIGAGASLKKDAALPIPRPASPPYAIGKDKPAKETPDDGVGLPAVGAGQPAAGRVPAKAGPAAAAEPPRPKVPPRREPDVAKQPPGAPVRPPVPARAANPAQAPADKPVPLAMHASKASLEADLPGLPNRAAAVRQSGDALDMDLPNLRNPNEREPLESDLPAALGARRPANRPVDAEAAPVSGKGNAPVGALEMDLPETLSAHLREPPLPDLVKRPQRSSPGIDLDLPSPAHPAVRSVPNTRSNPPPDLDDFEFDLPSPLQSQQALPELLSHRGSGEARRGTMPGGFELPDLEADLPRSSTEGIGLPSIPGRTGQAKKTLAGSGPPRPRSAESDAPAPTTAAPIEVDLGLDFEMNVDEGIRGNPMLVDMEPSLPPAAGATTSRRSAAEFDLAMGDMELRLGPANFTPNRPVQSSVPPRAQSGMGGTDYGEVSLESSDREVAVETETAGTRRSLAGEGLEFGAVPQASDAVTDGGPAAAGPAIEGGAATGTTPVARHGLSEAQVQQPRSKRARLLGAGALVLAAVGGSALTLLPDIGPFGSHFIADQLGRKQNDALVERYAAAGHQVLATDDYSQVLKSLSAVEVARRDHERLRSLKAFAAYFAYAIELRHGSQPQTRASAKVMLDELGDRNDLRYLRLASAARAAVEGNLAKARSTVDAEVARDPRNADAQAISAEIALLDHRNADALRTWQLVSKFDSNARAEFGLARAHFALGQFDAAATNAQQTIAKNASHVGARLLLARIALVRHGTDEAEGYINAALALQAQQSVADFVLAKSLTGDLQLLRSRISLAESAYREALAKDPRSAPALRGLGETLYRAGRYSESLARFEAGLQADPDDVPVAVGVAKAQLALERVREAGTLLSRLRQASPKHYAVNYWHGKAEEAAGNRDEAEKAYAVAIEVGGTDPVVVDAYVSMALLKNQQGRREEAQKVLAAAQEKLPKMPKIHEAMGQLALAEGRYAAAVQNFNLAMSLDPSDLGIKFRLGVALRKNREFEAAAKVFDEVTAADRDYPGLALERGQLFEASGQTEEALRAFESALARAPSDPDLMLRVGCGKVAAGQAQQSEQLLKKVLEQRPTSAETHHCLGRAQLLDGSNLAIALRTLERAVELDPHRAEYYLYVGWAANEAGRVSVAEQALKKALELDQGLGDAYWQRGILRYRQGAVKDAVADLSRALELRPGRYEAHAALADAYFDLGLEAKALEQWRLAARAQPDNPTWRYRYGKLLQATHRDAEAKPELEAALEIAAKMPAQPRWAWEAHHLLARAIGQHPNAVRHWQAFLELAPRDNVYRDEAKQALVKLGQPWDRD